MNGLTPLQHDHLLRPLNATRVARRSQGGKSLSYLESWDVRAHLIRVFGFGNFDIDLIDQHFVGQREYQSGGDNPKPMVEVSWFAKVGLTIRAPQGFEVCHYSDAAVGSTSGPASMIGEHHDNAIKTAASDALKRCAINLGTQFGLSLYDNGTTNDVVKKTLVAPDGVETAQPNKVDEAAEKAVVESLGGTPVETPEATTGETQEEGTS